MNANKYANLPDIDTAQDIYETEDVFVSSRTQDESSDDEAGPTRSAVMGVRGGGALSGKDELDLTNLMSNEEATRRFRRAERKEERQATRTHYVYPVSPTSPSTSSYVPPVSQRLRMLQAELAALEAEVSDPSNPHLQADGRDGTIDPGELVRGLADVRGRLEKISKGKEGRGRLVSVVLGNPIPLVPSGQNALKQNGQEHVPPETKDIADIDRRIGKLEKLVGASSVALDELAPLPPPLLPMLARLNSQMTILTQPRHIDSISRRLKLLLSDLDRAATSQHNIAGTSQRRQSGQLQAPAPPPSALQEQMAPLLTRLAPSLPHIPHILTRLRTLSTLHTSAANFQTTLQSLEAGQKRSRLALDELTRAINGVEVSLEDNDNLVKGNVTGLEERMGLLLKRLEEANQ